MEAIARIVAESIGNAGYQVTVSTHPGQPPVATATGRDGRVLRVTGDDELVALTELTRRILIEGRK